MEEQLACAIELRRVCFLHFVIVTPTMAAQSRKEASMFIGSIEKDC